MYSIQFYCLSTGETATLVTLQQNVTVAPVFVLPYSNGYLTLDTDLSDSQMGPTLKQNQPNVARTAKNLVRNAWHGKT